MVLPDLALSSNKNAKNVGLWARIAYIKSVTTVEPIIACFFMATVLCKPALVQLEFEKACKVNLRFNDTVCDSILRSNIKDFMKENDAIQIMISDMHSWTEPLKCIMPLILILFLGSYSDRYKIRKPFLLLPIFGKFFSIAGCLLCVINMRRWPLEVLGILHTVIPSFFGGQTMIITAVYAYIADVSSIEMRTLRVGVVQIVLNVCSTCVQSISGILFVHIGYVGMFLLALVLFSAGLVYGVFQIEEASASRKCIIGEKLLVDMFDPKHAIDTFKFLFNNSNKDRCMLYCMLFMLFVWIGVDNGETNVLYLFTQTSYQWTQIEYSYYLTAVAVVSLIGTSLAVPLFTKVLQIDDIIIIVVAFFDKVISNMVYSFAKTVTLFCAAMVMGIVTGMATVAIRSIATKVVDRDDLGKAQSLFGIFEAIAPAIAVPIYNKGIYVQTLDKFPGAFFLPGVALFAFNIVVLLWFYFKQKEKLNNKLNVCISTIEDVQITHM